MKIHGRDVTWSWWMSAVIIVLMAGHLVVSYALSHVALSAGVISGVVVFLVDKHLGVAAVLAGPVLSRFRRHR
jgi:hypothetical protein